MKSFAFVGVCAVCFLQLVVAQEFGPGLGRPAELPPSVFDGRVPTEGLSIPPKGPKPDQPRGLPPGYDNTRKIVVFNDRGQGEPLLLRAGGKKLLDLPAGRAAAFSLPLPAQALNALRTRGPIKSIEDDPPVFPTARTPLQTLLAEAGDFNRSSRKLLAEEVPYGLSHVQALGLSDANAGQRHVCIVDSGYNSAHPDFQGTNVNPPDSSGDLCGHGTHVMGTIAAIGGNNIGVTSINPNGKVRISTVKVFGDNCVWNYASDIYNALEVCRNRGANVISLSLGSSFNDGLGESYTKELYDAGILVVAAAGNDGSGGYQYPASFTSVMSVGANDESKTTASFSQSNDQVDISAPGVNVLSTYKNNGYQRLSGTSMATPHVSGVAALVWSRNLACLNSQIRNALQHTALDLGPAGRDNDYGAGSVRALAADTCLKMLGCNCPSATCAAGSGQTCTAALTWDDPLPTGKALWSADKTKLLFMQGDGNLVVYSTTGGPWTPLFATRTANKGAARVILQSDGDLVIYTSANARLWAAGTGGIGATRLVMQNNGQAVLTNSDGRVKWTTLRAGYDDLVAADWPGNILASGCGMDLDACANSCNNAGTCVGFFFRQDGCCWTKTALPGFPSGGNPVQDGVTFRRWEVPGYQRPIARDWPGNNLANDCGLNKDSCANFCNADSRCMAFFMRPDGCCWLKGGLPGFPSGGVAVEPGLYDGVTVTKQVAVTGYGLPVSSDWPGRVISSACGLNRVSCAERCNNEANCVGFYIRQDGCCFTKPELPGYPSGGVPQDSGSWMYRKAPQLPGYDHPVSLNFPGYDNFFSCGMNTVQCSNSCTNDANCFGFFIRPDGCCWTKSALIGSGISMSNGELTFNKITYPGYSVGVAADWPLGNDIGSSCGESLATCATKCNNAEACVGIFYRSDRCCWLKRNIGNFPYGGVPSSPSVAGVTLKKGGGY